jgi:hypothetical protein
MRCGARILKLSLVNALLIIQVFQISIIQSTTSSPPRLGYRRR